LEEVWRELKDMHLLATISGIGTFLACLLVAVIRDVRPFRDASALRSYAGLVTSIR
jgi:transposase